MENNPGVKRLAKVATEFNVGVHTIMDFLNKNGFPVDNANAKIGEEAYTALLKEFHVDKSEKQESMKISLSTKKENPAEEITAVVPEETKRAKETPVKETPAKEVPAKEVPAKEIPVKETPAPEEIASPVTEEIKAIEEEPEPRMKPKVVGKINLEDVKGKGKKKTTAKKEEVVIEEKPVEEVKKIIPEKSAETVVVKPAPEEHKIRVELPGVKLVGKIEVDNIDKKSKGKKEDRIQPAKKKPAKEDIPVAKKEPEIIPEPKVIPPVEEKAPEVVPSDDERYLKTEFVVLTGPKQVGKIDVTQFEKKPAAKVESTPDKNRPTRIDKKHRPRIQKKEAVSPATPNVIKGPDKNKSKIPKPKRNEARPAPSEEDIQKHIKETLSQLQGAPKSKSSKYRRLKRDAFQLQRQEEMEELEKGQSVLKVNEFITVSELASMMNVPAVKVIQSCMGLGLFVSLNQRLDAEAITIVASEFGFDVNFISLEDEQMPQDDDDDTSDNLVTRAPVVTVMGHVDHGKTSLLDNIRKSNIIAGESGGITQHIGAYEVTLEGGRKIAFLDTPGHEAFTAMRARGAKITDVAIIVIAADDQVMPQTVEAINHARAAGVPMVFAISKIDKPGSNPEKIKEQLANMNLLVEDWGGKYQCQEIDAKHGVNIDILLEKVLLESDMLDLKANPDKLATGTVIESSLDKGRGYMATVLVHAGTLQGGDVVLAGSYYGRVKAMFNERNQPVKTAGPSTPVLILGLNGAPAAGDRLTCYKDEKVAKDLAFKRQQLIREQSLRTQKHITLDEIGRRIAIGDFKELNIIVKGDVDGSVEALSDALLKLSASSVQVNVIHKAIGGITESDVLLATASNAIIIGFQVRPSVAARKLAESEEIDIRTYSVIYDAIEEVKAAMEGMLEPKIEEKVVASIEVREVFKITKLGTIAGCMVLDGKINRNSKIHLIRNGIVVHTGGLSSLKRFKDDVKEVLTGQDCGIGINNFNDLKEGDIIEAFTEIEVQRKL
ncbi:MAG: translation initiation factor IF-2 [Bacteroidetes bacterium GWF2_43_63]|nr:MAG: translation initiation factor IF-2 [Bacteroidetes bacterium GWE2_42_42]OFY52910.1 MAG: translation initiation factor IF-2 [Bacteroidetes bacterium GWF2_43_63]HBG70117.1 translation initiation factor IF-2 [Bacteroidales bacterium]HCB62276.1 translation initiation factor IF-2 [Bacteroidales bacterium]